MHPSTDGNTTQDWLRLALRYVRQLDGLEALSKLLDVGDVVHFLWDKTRYRGVYEILDYDATLEIMDPKGKESVLTRRQVIRFLQDNVVAIHDHAWGDGEIFASYQCQPGVPVDFYEDGSKWNVLISLRETKNKGDTVELWIRRVVKRGSAQAE